MRELTFRPLRLIKKTGKITVASYMQWRKVKCADYHKFSLTIHNDYKHMPLGAPVHDHNGEQLFFYTYNPNELPIWEYTYPLDFSCMLKMQGVYTIGGKGQWYVADGMDIDGVPVFSHYNMNHIGTHHTDMNKFEPLTVGMVVRWFGWFLLQLDNSYLKIGTD